MTILLQLAGTEFRLASLSRSDADSIAVFAEQIPPHDLLFLSRDIRNPRVVDAWLEAIARDEIESLAAFAGNAIVATTALIRDRLSWSAHVAEIRLIVLPEWRGKGLGRAMLEAGTARAIENGATKLMARMTPDQRGAITLFEEAGFRGEAMLTDQVRDQEGQAHDLAILSLDVARAFAHKQALRS